MLVEEREKRTTRLSQFFDTKIKLHSFIIVPLPSRKLLLLKLKVHERAKEESFRV